MRTWTKRLKDATVIVVLNYHLQTKCASNLKAITSIYKGISAKTGWKDSVKDKLTVLSNDDLAHLLQPGDKQLVSHNQHIADKLYIQGL